MKKIFMLILGLVMCFCLSSCNSNNKSYKENEADEFYLKYDYNLDSSQVKNANALLSGFYHNTEKYGDKGLISLVTSSVYNNGNNGSCSQFRFIEEFLNKRSDVKFYYIYVDNYLGEGDFFKDQKKPGKNVTFGDEYIDNFYKDVLGDILVEARGVYQNSPFGKAVGSFDWTYGWDKTTVPFTFYVDNTAAKPSYASEIYQISEVYPTSFDSATVIENMVDHTGVFA